MCIIAYRKVLWGHPLQDLPSPGVYRLHLWQIHLMYWMVHVISPQGPGNKSELGMVWPFFLGIIVNLCVVSVHACVCAHVCRWCVQRFPGRRLTQNTLFAASAALHLRFHTHQTFYQVQWFVTRSQRWKHRRRQWACIYWGLWWAQLEQCASLINTRIIRV